MDGAPILTFVLLVKQSTSKPKSLYKIVNISDKNNEKNYLS